MRNQRHFPKSRRHVTRTLGRRIFIVDVDNVLLAGTDRTDPGAASRRLHEVTNLAGRWDLSLAVASRRILTESAGWQLATSPGLTWRLDPGGTDAADHVLLDFAYHHVYADTAAEVVVASGDGIFAQLASAAQLQVVVPADHEGVSNSLRRYRVTKPVAIPSQRSPQSELAAAGSAPAVQHREPAHAA